jgi:hypothetical protein
MRTILALIQLNWVRTFGNFWRTLLGQSELDELLVERNKINHAL